LKGRGTETLETPTQPLSPSSQIEETDDQERRFYDLTFYSLLGVENCPTNGGKLKAPRKKAKRSAREGEINAYDPKI
jgi:hypothetical protein